MNTRTFHHEACALLVRCNHSPNVSTNKCSCVIRTSIGFFRTQNHKMAERISDRKFLDADPFEVKLRDKFFWGVRNIKNSRDTILSALKQKLEIGTRNEWTTVKGLNTYNVCTSSSNRQLPVSVNLVFLSLAVEKWLEISWCSLGCAKKFTT